MAQSVLAGDPFRGATLYTRHCQECHGVKGKSPLPGVPEFTWWGGSENGLNRSDRQLLDRIRGG
ncbi:MAG: c-type cytochrome, partial [Magnetococcales bacterium]|nr:c-type cytochrome [Magnetococcales bacterium]